MKKRLLVCTAAMLCICLAAIGTSMAFFTNTSHVENVFSFVGENGIDAELTEPKWEPESGREVVPNERIPKDPQVTNTSAVDMDILVALKVEFVYGEKCPEEQKVGKVLSQEDMAYVCDVYGIDWNADDVNQGEWIRFDGEDASCPVQQFYYNGVLERNYPAQGDTTEPLFTSLTVSKDVNNERYSHIQDMGGFDIRITGRALQQMTGDVEFGIGSPQDAYDTGLFDFEAERGGSK